ncbi:MAG: WD40 repeat domain-containing protein [Anaerolineae bacterium]|nr:WD40 repeat domain-containing protein [Anaerolineae bacterium]
MAEQTRPSQRLLSAEQVAALMAQMKAMRQPKSFDGRCPYVGSRPFQEADARLYFGRESAIDELLDRIEQGRSVAITGAEHVGKTSLIQAGLVFGLRNGALLGSERWLIHTFTPGSQPLHNLVEACAAVAHQAKQPPMAIAALRERGLSDLDALYRFLEMLPGQNGGRLVLIADQVEAIFARPARDPERVTFARFLAHTKHSDRVILVAALRSSALPELSAHPELAEWVERHRLDLQPLSPRELVRAIVLPALETGVEVEPQLVARLIEDALDQPYPLVALQKALHALFMALPHRRGREVRLTLADYEYFGPIRPAAPLADSAQSAAPQPLVARLGEAQAISQFERQEAQVRLMRVVTGVAGVAAIAGLALGAVGLLQNAQAGERARVAATSEARAQALATAAEQLASQAQATRLAAEASAASAEAARAAAVATRTQAEQNAALAAQARATAQANESAAIALATSVVNREQNALRAEATASALATQSASEVASARAARATAEADRQRTRARELAALALTQLDADPQLAVLVAVEAYRTLPLPQTEDALRRAFARAFPEEGAFRHPNAVTDAQLSEDGARLLTGCRDGIGRVWDVQSGTVLTALRGHSGWVTRVAFAPDGSRLLTGSTDRTARVWNAGTGRTAVVLSGHTAAVSAVAFSPDGALVATGSADRTVRLWDAATGQPALGEPIQVGAPVSQVVFIGSDQIGVRTAQGAQRFDVRTGALLGEWVQGEEWQVESSATGVLSVRVSSAAPPLVLYGHTASATLADRRADRLVTVSADSTARIHLVRPEDLVVRAQVRVGRELTCQERVRLLSEDRQCP